MFVAGALPALVLVPLIIRYLSGPDAQGATAMPVTRSRRASRETISGLFRGRSAASDAGVLGRHVHGSVADLRAEHLASRDHARCRVLSGQFAGISADPQSGSHPRISSRRAVRRPRRSSPDSHRLVRWSCIFLAVFALPLPEPILLRGPSALRLRELFHHHHVMPL